MARRVLGRRGSAGRPAAGHAQLTAAAATSAGRRRAVIVAAAAAAALLHLHGRESETERLVVELLQVEVVALLQEPDPLGALLLELLALLHHLTAAPGTETQL